MSATIRLLIARSIKLGLRTREEWKAHREAMRLVESNQVLDWAMEESSDDRNDPKRKPGRPGNHPLSDGDVRPDGIPPRGVAA